MIEIGTGSHYSEQHCAPKGANPHADGFIQLLRFSGLDPAEMVFIRFGAADDPLTDDLGHPRWRLGHQDGEGWPGRDSNSVPQSSCVWTFGSGSPWTTR